LKFSLLTGYELAVVVRGGGEGGDFGVDEDIVFSIDAVCRPRSAYEIA
jgi:hypothetical protein